MTRRSQTRVGRLPELSETRLERLTVSGARDRPEMPSLVSVYKTSETLNAGIDGTTTPLGAERKFDDDQLCS